MTDIVFITPRFPYPLNKGDKLRAFHQLEGLSEQFRVHLIAIDENTVSDSDIEVVKAFCASVNVFVVPKYKRIFQVLLSPLTKLPLQVAYFHNRRTAKKINHLIGQIAPIAVHCHTIRVAGYCHKIKGPSFSLDFMDAFGKGMERRERAESNLLKRLLFRYEKNQLYCYETAVFSCFDRFCIISEQDKQEITSSRKGEIEIIPNGVDFRTFSPKNEQKLYDLVFMGNMSYPPNIDAVIYLCTEILPLIRQTFPEIRLLIAGIGAGPTIESLRSAYIDVRSDFEHISDSIALSKIMIAPMRLSIGLQNKILQSMAMEVPCVVSKLSNNAIGAPNPETIRECETPEEFAAQVKELLLNPETAHNIAQSASNFVREQYSWQQKNEQLANLIL
jgi:glycosyltransferase involved in cell wall biosynthesis